MTKAKKKTEQGINPRRRNTDNPIFSSFITYFSCQPHRVIHTWITIFLLIIIFFIGFYTRVDEAMLWDKFPNDPTPEKWKIG